MSTESTTPASSAVAAPERERIGLGTLLALLAIPVGVAVWLLVWSFGYIATIVAVVIALLVAWLYKAGAGRIGKAGAIIVSAIALVTLLVAFWAGTVYDFADALGELSGIGTWDAFTTEGFWTMYWELVPDAISDYVRDFVLTIVFGGVGIFVALRYLFAKKSD